MVSSIVLLLTTALAGMVSAQVSTNVTIIPSSVNETIREDWCTAEKNTCRSLCGGPGETSANDCFAQNLNFTCACTNGTSPDVAQYDQSLPAYICREYIDQCVANHPNDRDGQYECMQTQCGQLNATDPADGGSNPDPTTTSSAPSSTSGGGASNTQPAPSSTSGAAAFVGASYGTPALAAGLLALFGMAL